LFSSPRIGYTSHPNWSIDDRKLSLHKTNSLNGCSELDHPFVEYQFDKSSKPVEAGHQYQKTK